MVFIDLSFNVLWAAKIGIFPYFTKKVAQIITNSNIFTTLSEENDEHLHDNHADEHSERIDRCVGNARSVAFCRVVGVAECHRIGHRTTENAANRAVIIATRAQGCQTDNQNGNDGEQEAQANPQHTLGTQHGLEEVATGVEAEAGEVERKSQLTEHQRG